jgi:hypothetical protein
MSGYMNPSAGSFRRGTGEIDFDIDACTNFQILEDPTRSKVTFDTAPDADNPQGKTHGQILYHNLPVWPDRVQPEDTLYVYRENGDLSGDFYYELWTDVFPFTEEQTALELAEIMVVWNSEGSGRTDIRVDDGDLPEPFFIHECWDNDHLRVYYSDSMGLLPTEGEPSDCAFDQATFD